MDIRVAILCPYHPWSSQEFNPVQMGGVERCISALSERLADLGVKITIITSGSRNAEEIRNNIKIIIKKRTMVLYGSPLFKWKNEISNEYDIVHVHGTYPFLSDLSADVCQKLNVPTVLSYHFDGTANGAVGKALASLYYRTIGNKMKKHDKIIVTTKGYAESSRFLKNIPTKKIVIIPNGVDTSKFTYHVDPTPVLQKYNLEKGYVLFVGRLVPYKGVEYLLHAMKNTNYRVVIAGDGPLRHNLEVLGVGKYIGFVPDDDLPCLYRGAGVTVLPSITEAEAFGITLLESMACGTPVVATNLPGLEEIASLGGVCVQRKSAGALSEGIKITFAKEHSREHLHKITSKRFSWKRIVDMYIKLYNEVLGG